MRLLLLVLAAAFVTACGGAHKASKPTERPGPFADVPIVFGDAVPPLYFERYAVNPTVETLAEPTSTVALDPDTSSFDDVRRALRAGRRPAPGSVHTEAFINHAAGLSPPLAPLPSSGDALAAGPLSATAHAFPSPTRPGYHLLHLTVTATPDAPPPSDVVLAVDLNAPRSGLCSGAEHVLPRAAGRWSLVTFGRSVEVVISPTTDRDAVLRRLRTVSGCDGRTPSAPTLGVTSGAWPSALETALALARQGVPGARPQVIAWLGAVPEIRGGQTRSADLVFVRAGGAAASPAYASEMTALARAVGARAVAPPAAPIPPLAVVDVVASVRFDSSRVARYRLLGYERPRGRVGAMVRPGHFGGRLAAGQSASLLYEVKLTPGEGPLAELSVRARPLGAPSQSLHVAVPADRVFATADPLVAVAAAFAEHLRNSYWTRHITYDTLRAHFAALPPETRAGSAVAELGALIEHAAHSAPTRAVATPADFDRVPIVQR